MIDKTLEALERLMPLFEKSMRELVFTAEKAGEVTADMNTLRAALAAPSAGPVAIEAQLRDIERHSWRMGELWGKYQGNGWPDAEGDLFVKLRDETVPELRASILSQLATPAQPPAAQPVTTFEPWHLLKHRILPPGTEPTSSLHWGDEQAAAPSVEAEPVATEMRAQLQHLVDDLTWCPNPDDPDRRYIAPSKGLMFSNMVNAVRRLLAAPLQQPQEGWVSVPNRAARDVLAERQRQISAEGWTPEHDDEHAGGELRMAAVALALPNPAMWPTTWGGWSAMKDKGLRRNLVRATALMLAEIERLDRASPPEAHGIAPSGLNA